MNFSNNEDTFQQQALEIRDPGHDFDPSVLPQTGDEFLTHMKYERQRIPAVVVRRPSNIGEAKRVDNNLEAYFANYESLEDSEPTKQTNEWKAKQCADFLATRTKVAMLRASALENKLEGVLTIPNSNCASEWKIFCQEHEPLLSIILQIKQRMLEQLLEFLCGWLGSNNGETDDEIKKDYQTELNSYGATKSIDEYRESDDEIKENCQIKSKSSDATEIIDLTSSDKWLANWLYGTLVCLHLPLEPNVHSTLREIARCCIRLRSQLQPNEHSKKGVYNYFIHLIANIFQQLDFGAYI